MVLDKMPIQTAIGKTVAFENPDMPKKIAAKQAKKLELMKNFGYFIVLEGIDGSGTTTQTKLLADYIYDKSKDNHIFMTREPSISPYGKEIRKRLRTDKNPKENAEKYFELFLQDREYHLKTQILPNLRNEVYVICDRYELSTYAYQQTQGISANRIFNKHRELKIIHPDITFLLDLDPEISMGRVEKKGEAKEVFEKIEFQKELRKNYLEAVNKYINIFVIDSSKPVEEVHDGIVGILEKKLMV